MLQIVSQPALIEYLSYVGGLLHSIIQLLVEYASRGGSNSLAYFVPLEDVSPIVETHTIEKS
jgi:hypothetical protein